MGGCLDVVWCGGPSVAGALVSFTAKQALAFDSCDPRPKLGHQLVWAHRESAWVGACPVFWSGCESDVLFSITRRVSWAPSIEEVALELAS